MDAHAAAGETAGMDQHTQKIEAQLAAARGMVERVMGHAPPRLVEAVFVQLCMERFGLGDEDVADVGWPVH